MKPIFLFLISIILHGHLLCQNVNTSVSHKSAKAETDLYNRLIIDQEGNKSNYSHKETENLFQNSFVLENGVEKFNNAPTNNKSITSLGNTFECDPQWNYSIMGGAIGRRTMNSVDLNNDGIIEIICSAKVYQGNIWYIMEYDSLANNYKQVWVSDYFYTSYGFISIIVVDINNDGILEIITASDLSLISIYDGITKTLISQTNIPPSNVITNIDFGDADNDGSNELAVSTSTKIFLYDPSTLLLKATLLYGGYDFKIGNVDGDSLIEIVTTKGKVLYNNGFTTTEKWTFDLNVSNDNNYQIELSDIDNDGIKEIIRSKNITCINVYDADIQTLKYELQTTTTIDALLMQDVNNDGIDELIYGDGQWGSIYCRNAVSQALMWEIDNPDNGITAVNIADVNNDDTLEVMWATSWNSSSGDYFYVADMNTQLIEWKSVALDAPFNAIAVDDIDNDSVKEIVCISYESGSGYDSGIISVFNANTKVLEWQSDGDFLYSVWTGIFDCKIDDIDNDGNKEIIVAAGEKYDGKIWIIDGTTKAIESSYLFDSENLKEFFVLTVADVDNDGNKEIVVVNDDQYYYVNPVGFNIKYSSVQLTGTNPTKIEVENIDNDAENEVIFCKNFIYVFGGTTYQQWQSPTSDYKNFYLYDVNGDNKKDIVACTSNGYIKIFDGVTLQLISSIQMSNNSIDGIVVAQLNSDTIPEFVFTSKGNLNIYSTPNQHFTTKRYAYLAGNYNSLLVSDINDDSVKEIILGTTSSIIELTDDCYQCMWFSLNNVIHNVSCDSVDDGSIKIIPNGTPPYSYIWSNGSTDSVNSGLNIGTYLVTVSDINGCVFDDTLSVFQSQLTAEFSYSNESCNSSGDGTASVDILIGTPPYIFEWSNGADSSFVDSLYQGSYSVTVTDSANCSINNTFIIENQATLLNTSLTHVSCYGMSNGMISLNPQGASPFTYIWNTGDNTNNINNLVAGQYVVTVTNNEGCVISDTFNIEEPSEIITFIATTPDYANTPFLEGTAVVVATGGTPPYTYLWNDPAFQTTNNINYLMAGLYLVLVIDQNGCSKVDTANVGLITDINTLDLSSGIIMYPNPVNNMLSISNIFINQVKVEVFNMIGECVIQKEITMGSNDIDVSAISNGIYVVRLSCIDWITERKLIKQQLVE